MMLITKNDFVENYNSYYIDKMYRVAPLVTLNITGRIIKSNPLINTNKFCRCEDININLEGSNDPPETLICDMKFFKYKKVFNSYSASFRIILDEINNYCLSLMKEAGCIKSVIYTSRENINKLKKKELFYMNKRFLSIFNNDIFSKGDISKFLIEDQFIERSLFKCINLIRPTDEEAERFEDILGMNKLYIPDNVTITLDDIYKLINHEPLDKWLLNNSNCQNVIIHLLNRYFKDLSLKVINNYISEKKLSILKDYIKNNLGIYSFNDLIEKGYELKETDND